MLDDYIDSIADKIERPSEWLEHQLNMSEEEKAKRRELYQRLFREYGVELEVA